MKKTLRKTLAVLLVLALVFCSVCISVSAADNSVYFAVTTDIHAECNGSASLEHNFPENELYFHAGGSGNLYDETPGLLKSFLAKAAAQNVDFVLVSGDLTRSGTPEEHAYVSSVLEAFTAETGIKVYVIPGNHDYFHTTPEEFKEYYNNVSYANALVVDSETGSYTADLPDDYRLIAVDSTEPGDDGDGLTDRLFGWIDEQVQAARADGKEIIYSMHHPLLEHLYLGKILMSDFIVRNYEDVAEKFCNWGIQYVFTGHEHGNDVAKFTGKNGNTVYDVLTTSLSSYPLEYRTVTYSKSGVTLEMNSIDECDFSSLKDGYTQAQLDLMAADYNAYAYGYFRYSIEEKILKYTSPDFIKGKLKAETGLLAGEIDSLMTFVNDALKMPLYDDGSGELSIEALAAKKGVAIPESEYKSLVDLATALVALHYYGDENLPSSEAVEGELFVKGLNTGLEYILANVEGHIADEILAFTSANAGAESDALNRWFSAAGSEDSYEVAEKVLYPLLDKYTYDNAPADRDVTLPALGETEVKESGIASFFKKFLEIILNILDMVFTGLIK